MKYVCQAKNTYLDRFFNSWFYVRIPTASRKVKVGKESRVAYLINNHGVHLFSDLLEARNIEFRGKKIVIRMLALLSGKKYFVNILELA